MKKEIQSIIFDLDGVICSTDEFHYQAWSALAQRLGIAFDRTINNRLRGVSRLDSLNIVLEKSAQIYTPEEKQLLAEEKNQTYARLLQKMTPEDLPEGVMQTLKILRQKGYKMAIGSSSKNAKLILKQIGLSDFFDAVADGTMITHSKPNPEVFLLAAKLLNTELEHCVVVEDAVAGIQAALAARMTAVGIAEKDTATLADAFVEKFSDLLNLLFYK